MEVASPLPFTPGQAGSKRPFACSPPLIEAAGHPSNMDLSDDVVMQPNLKRRRFNQNDSAESQSVQSTPPVYLGVGLSARSHFAAVSGNKRTRIESDSNRDIDRVVQEQAEEIENLKSERDGLQASLHSLKEDHEKVVNENRILKRAVTIQQERQNQAATELEAARRFKVDADDRVRTLEQLVVTMRYHLQAQQSNAGNDFMGLPPRPPDVY